MEKTWKPTVAGVLDIISGVGMLFVCIGLLIAGVVLLVVGGDVPQWLPCMLLGITAPLLVLTVLAVLGGVYAVQHKKWGLALTGAICAFFCCFVLGILSIIFTATSRGDFEK